MTDTMDDFYNTEKARELLEAYAELRKGALEAGPGLAELAEMNGWPDTVKVMEAGVPVAWRLIIKDEGEMEEIVFHIQGIVVGKDLPPILNKPSRHVKIGHLRQSITISGLGSKSFDKAVCGVGVVDSQFRRHVNDRRMEDTMIIASYKGHPALELSNRYFTSRVVAKSEEAIPFRPLVDPKGILEALAGSGHVHLAENMVEYQQRKVGQEGEQWFEDATPSNIRLGDVVEAQISLLAVHTRKDKFRTVAVLRCVTLLDSSIMEDTCKQKRMEAPSGKLKRKVGHWNEMAAQLRVKQAKMVRQEGDGDGRDATEAATQQGSTYEDGSKTGEAGNGGDVSMEEGGNGKEDGGEKDRGENNV